MADRYNNINNTSPYVSALKNEKNNVPTSNFDYSRSHHGNMNIGTLEILDCFPTLPKGSYNLSLDLLLKVRVAMKKRIMTGQRVYVHAWYMSYNDLWEGAQNHIDHGRSGLIDIEKPYTDGYIYEKLEEDTNPTKVGDICTPNSPLNQIGIPVRSFQTSTTYGSTPPLIRYIPSRNISGSGSEVHSSTVHFFETKINALPLAMYQRLYLDKYAPKNLLQDNKDAYPDNAEKIRIAYNITKIQELDKNGGNDIHIIGENAGSFTKRYEYQNPNSTAYTLEKSINSHNDIYDTAVTLGLKRYRQKKGDYFVTSSPFADLLRGDAPTIDLAGFSANVDFNDVFSSVTTSGTNSFKLALSDNTSPSVGLDVHSTSNDYSTTKNNVIKALNKAKVQGNVQTQATANMLRTLIALTLIKERNALTNGDYNEMVKAQFGYSPNVDDYSAKYIGGFYQDIVFSDVTQTSITESSSPLGNQAGQAMSANSGYIGKFTAPDYGYIMIIASIVPDEIYNQGIPRFLGELSSDEEYTSPILNNLPPQPIKNKEIYLTNSESTNEDVFSYTQRYEHLRHRENYASGFVGLSSLYAPEDSSYIQHLIFQNSPQFNAKFVSLCPDNVDMSPYSVIDEPPYIFTAISNIDKIEPLPYDSIPSDFGFKYA